MKSFSFTQLFALLFTLFAVLLAGSTLFAWTGPTATAPNGNVSAPINVGTTDQVKNAGLSVNSLADFGGGYVSGKLGVGVSNPSAKVHIVGDSSGVNGLYVQTISSSANSSPYNILMTNDRGLLAQGNAGIHGVEVDYLGNFRIERPQVVSSMPDLTITPAGRVGIAQISPAALLDVNGSAKIGNGGETCQASTAGAIRYNSANARMEYCDGSTWAAVGAAIVLASGTISSTGLVQKSDTFTLSDPGILVATGYHWANNVTGSLRYDIVVDGTICSYDGDNGNGNEMTSGACTMLLGAGTHTITSDTATYNSGLTFSTNAASLTYIVTLRR